MIKMINFGIPFNYINLIFVIQMNLIVKFYFYCNYHLPKKIQWCMYSKKENICSSL